MDTQCDSIDIDNLRNFALGIGDLNDSQQSDASPRATALTDNRLAESKALPGEQDRPMSSKLRLGHHRRDASSSSGQHTKSRPKPSSALRLTASQPQLPSTVPDSHDTRMAVASIQSQGDTQPLSQGVQEEFTSRIKEQQRMSASNATGLQDLSHSYQPGETGHIDFVTDFEQPSVNDFDDLNGQDEDIDPISQVADVRAEPYPESKRFREPKTPATIGRKRARDGASISRENTTPRLPVNPFAGQTGQFEGMMNASQAFKATQFTSPLPNQAVTEGFSDRPSPNMYDPPRPSTADPTSTPAKLPRSNMVRAVTEPQTTYVSMKESQAERERQLLLSAPPAHEESEDDFNSDSSELRRRRKRRRDDLESRVLFEAVKAKARPAPSRRGRGGRRAYIQRPSPPRQSGRAPAEPVLISDDPLADGNVTEDETEHESDHSDSDSTSIDELAEDNKENIGIKRVQVPMTASRLKAMKGVRTTSQMSPSQSRTKKHPRSSSTWDASEPRERRSTASTEVAESAPKATQTVAIVDSQPSRNTDSTNPPRHVHQETTIPQSSPEPRMIIPQSQLSQHSQAGKPEVSDEVEVSAKILDVPASSTVQPAPSGTSIADFAPVEAVPTMNSMSSEDHAPLENTENAATEHVSGTPNRVSANPWFNVSPSSTSMAHNATAAREVVLAAEEEGPSGHRVPLAATIARDNRDHTSNSTRSEDHTTQARVSDTMSEASSIKMHGQLHAAFLASSNAPRSTNASSKPVSNPQTSILSNSDASTAFHTAATHMTGSPSRSRLTQISSKHTTPSPKKLRSRTIAEIAANPSPPDLIGTVDIDVGILTNDDVEFQSVVKGSSPIMRARKRRRGRDGRIVQVADSEPTGVQLTVESLATNMPTGDVPSSPPPVPSREQPYKSSRGVSSAVEAPAIPPHKPSAEHAAGVSSSDSDPLIAGTPTPTLETASPPSAVPAGSRKRGRPKKVIKNTATSDQHDQSASAHNAATADKVLRIEVPGTRTGENDGLDSSVSGSVLAPNRVFARFNGQNCAAYYPATCIGVLDGEQPRYRVRFDDGTVDSTNGYAIKRLELRRGDHVKLDMGGARKNTYVVEKVQDRQQPLLTPDPDTPTRHGPSAASAAHNPLQTDIKGHGNVVISLKQAKSSDMAANDNPITVPMKDVYLTQTMWTNFRDRSYTYQALRPQFASKLQTPSERPSNPSTPSSRGRRTKAPSTTHPRSTLNPTPAAAGIFSNMAFAITNISDTSLRTTLRHQICNNSGRLLAEGFDELFHIPTLGSASPSKRTPKKDTDTSFQLSNAGKQTGFTCLIADKHCRMAKYIQALALGIPCLASRWIQDCVSKQRLVPWQPYLLAAGESTFLGGAVRSRQLPDFPPETTSLSNIFDRRSKPLGGDSVLLIVEKGEEEKLKSHPLITHALGARKVSKATNLEAAARAVEEAQISGEMWDWVYSHDKEDKMQKTLFGRGSGSKKRKRESTSAATAATKGKTRVVGNEFVIQSLILGQLVE